MPNIPAIRRAVTCAPLVLGLLLLTILGMAAAGTPARADAGKPKLAVISTAFVLENKFRMIAEAARAEGVDVQWLHVDTAAPGALEAALEGADLVLIDAPRSTDIAQVEAAAGEAVRASGLPSLRVSVMNRGSRMQALGLPPGDMAETLFAYWVAGTAENHRNLARYIATWVRGGDLASVAPPRDLPNGGIYHPAAAEIFADLSSYLEWWQARNGPRGARPVLGMEFSSSYISDGQTRMLDDIIAEMEARDAVPLAFYRSTRIARSSAANRTSANGAAAKDRGGKPGPQAGKPERDARPASAGKPAGTSGRPNRAAETDIGTEFPNPRPYRRDVINEPLVTLNGRILPDVLLVNTFIGGNPDGRKAWLQSMDRPVIHLMRYRGGDRAAYLADTAGVNTFSLSFTLTNSEYIGMQDPVMLSLVEDGEVVPMPEQLDHLLDKAMRLAVLRHKPNAEKRVAMVYWNTPAGEANMGGSNLNLPLSMLDMAAAMRGEGYDVSAFSEDEIIARAHAMQAPRYREEAMGALVQGEDWAFLPVDTYREWFATLPAEVQDRIDRFWGIAEESQWLVKRDGRLGFAIPRVRLGNLTILPQPPRGMIAMAGMEDMEHDLFHDDKVPVNHPYLATYLWLRQTQDALIHFGTHGSQEWTPGKERGLWAFDDPQLLAGDIPILYPYIVDNIGEAIHVKRRGRGVIVSHQTPAFAPAGLSPDLTALNDLFLEYHTVVEGPARENLRRQITAKAEETGFDKDIGLAPGELAADFETHARDLETLIEDLGSQMQPLGLHTFGTGPDTDLAMASNIMQMMGAPFYDALGVDPGEIFKASFETLGDTLPMRFVTDHVLGDAAADPAMAEWVKNGRRYHAMLEGHHEIDAVLAGLSGRWIDPSYGGDPIRNPDALRTGRNVYGFDPTRIPTRNAYAAAEKAMAELIATHAETHGAAPKKLAFTMWSTETMRHLGLLEAQIMVAMGVRPVWDKGGRVTGMEVIPAAELGRPRIDPVISLTGLYRDQFPAVIERLNEGIVLVNALDEDAVQNPLRANTARIADALRAKGIEGGLAESFALTRIYGNESGNYGTGLPDAVMMSGDWEENDGQLADGYMMRMSWGYGPDKSLWSQRLGDGKPGSVNAYAMQLSGTDAAVFSRSSNLRGLLDTDHPFEYLGGLSMAIRAIDGESPQLYISNMRDPNRTKLQAAERFMASELRAVYQHPRWVAEMKDEGFAGTLALLKTVNNFWGWQAMDRNIVRDDQWREFMAVYVEDRYELGVREWFEDSNPQAMAQITERMIEAIRKGYWDADEDTLRELVEVYQDVATRHDVVSDNRVFTDYVAEQAAGFGLTLAALAPDMAAAAPQQPAQSEPLPEVKPEQTEAPTETVTGQKLEQKAEPPAPPAPPQYRALIPFLLIGFGFLWQGAALALGRDPTKAGDVA
ncbi:cobaltochelatase subunit CobN [Thalassovita aquimarina]|uniref:cobaltochelatase subunit CobN n=1 Tax=Thalassovita aquimarina TaxID=2785917 RepID=UPI003562E663